LINDRKLADSLAKKAKSTIKNKFNIDNAVLSYEALYKDIVKRK
jgi:hypothetical protein